MKKAKLLLLGLPILLGLTSSNVFATKQIFGDKSISKALVEKEYKINTIFILPTYEKDGVTYDVTIEFPSGNTFYQKEVLLSEVGVYTLHFVGEKDGEFLSEDISFLVRSPFANFSGPKSFAKYEQSDRTYNQEGLFVSLKEGEKLTFNETISLNKSTFIELFAAPTIAGNADFTELYVDLTDVNDPENVLSVRLKGSTEGISNPVTYVSAKGRNQVYAGYEQKFNKVHINNDFGCPVVHSFYADYKQASWSQSVVPGKAKISLSYDDEEKTLKSNSLLVCDFDDSKFFSSLWDGFSDKEVTVTLHAKSYLATEANFVITSLLGKDLTKETIIDNTPPEITLDFPYVTAPKAKVGSTYPVFKGTAIDKEDGECKLTTKVYYGNNDKYQTIVPIVDNRFNIDYEGLYTIVYESKDRSGNVASKKVLVSTDDVKEITVLPKGELKKEGKLGEIYNFPELEFTGGTGQIKGNFKVYKDEKLYASEATSFIPKELGTYKITYLAKDVIGQEKEYSYSFEATANDGAVLYNDITFPKYYISGSLYYLPEANCVDYSSGKGEEVLMDVTIDNGIFSYDTKSGSPFIPKIESSQEDLIITYKYKNVSFEKKVKTIRPTVFKGGLERFDIANYLIKDNFSLDVGDTEIICYVNQKGNASLAFVNSILAENSSIQFATYAEKANYQGLAITFKDSLNENEAVTITIQENALGNLDFKIDNRSYPTAYSFKSNDNLTFSYSNNYFSFNGAGILAKKYDNGSTFEGFSSKKVYLEATLLKAKTNSAIKLTKIDNQSMAYSSSDYAEPRILIHGDYGGIKNFNDIVYINKVEASDVLDPNCSISVAVTKPDQSYAYDTNGMLLKDVPANQEYSLKLEEFGQYIVSYTATDSSDNKANFFFAYNVEDVTAPTIELLSEVPSEIKVGEYFKVPSFKVTDEKEEDVIVSIFIETSNGEIIYLGTHNAFKPKNEGNYKMRIRAMDKAGNVSYLELPFRVTK